MKNKKACLLRRVHAIVGLCWEPWLSDLRRDGREGPSAVTPLGQR